MPVIGISGPNAIGKTTACYRWLRMLPGKLEAAIADGQWEARSETDRTRIREWNGTNEQKGILVAQKRADSMITIVDSARTTPLLHFEPTDPVILVTCTAELLEQFIRNRCERSNKKYRADYWTESKLGYESHRRYLNFASTYLHPSQVHHFTIRDQAKDWPAVDRCFIRIFAKLHNK
jgi:deoxyadenosine/deoxycytidine kinase